MTATGVHISRLTDFPGRDESPDWQSIPAPDTDRRCGELGQGGRLRRTGRAGGGLRCRKALQARAHVVADEQPDRLRRYDVATEDFGGSRAGRPHPPRSAAWPRLVTFLFQPPAPPPSSGQPSSAAAAALLVRLLGRRRRPELAGDRVERLADRARRRVDVLARRRS